MTQRTILPVTVVLALIGQVLSAPSLFAVMPDALTEEQVAKISPAAITQFTKAATEFDYIRYDQGLVFLNQAAANDTTNVPLQFYTSRSFHSRAFLKKGEESKEYYDNALAAVDRILDNKNIREKSRREAVELKEQLLAEKENVDARDAEHTNTKQAMRRIVVENMQEYMRLRQARESKLREERIATQKASALYRQMNVTAGGGMGGRTGGRGSRGGGGGGGRNSGGRGGGGDYSS